MPHCIQSAPAAEEEQRPVRDRVYSGLYRQRFAAAILPSCAGSGSFRKPASTLRIESNGTTQEVLTTQPLAPWAGTLLDSSRAGASEQHLTIAYPAKRSGRAISRSDVAGEEHAVDARHGPLARCVA